MEEVGMTTSPILLLAKARSKMGEVVIPTSTHPSLAVLHYVQAALARPRYARARPNRAEGSTTTHP